MLSNRSHGLIVAAAIAIVLASLLIPGAVAQQAGQSESEPNDSPQNATFVAPGTPVSGEINSTGANVSDADADWFVVSVQQGQEVTVRFESGNDSERMLVFLASPSGSRNVSAVNDTLADATIAPPGSTVTLSATANESRLYFVGVTGLSGNYEFTVETRNGMAMGENGTNATDAMNGTNGTGMANTSETTTTTTTTAAPTTTSTQTTQTTESTSAASTAGSGGDGESGGNARDGGGSGEGTSASGPGFGLLAALVALLAAALLAARRR